MHHRFACGLALLATFAACDNDPTGPDVPIGVLGPSPIGATIPIDVEVVATGLVSPIQLVQPPGSDTRRFVVDQIGLIRVINADGSLQAAPYLDLRSRITPLNPGYDERGLLGMAFHPNFNSNGRFVVFYTISPRAGAPAGFNHTNVISEFQENRATGVVTGTERIILQVDHPQGNHNGGTVAFGPDQYLYISIGDGGAGNDVGLGHVDDWYAANAGGNGQDITQNLLGNILRIDVDGAQPYAIPGDNPFVEGPGRDEIWAYGFRNPYRMAFDPGGNRSLLVGDAGQELWEEVSRVVKGGNFGWNVREGTHCFSTATPAVSPAECPAEDPTTGEILRSPVIEFANSKNPAGGLSLTVVGGNVYRGSTISYLRGMYVFGGFGSVFTAPSGTLYAAEPRTSGLWTMYPLLINGTQPLGSYVKGFGQDRAGEVYVMATQAAGPSGTTGRVLRIRPSGVAN
ncbi:MAG: PQQ-dependent sugar dehydrogenase [Longimicrobiaceae bacterium]